MQSSPMRDTNFDEFDLALLTMAAVSLSMHGPTMSRRHYFASVLPDLSLIVFLSFAPQCSLSLDRRKCHRHAQSMAKRCTNTYSLYLNCNESLNQPLSSTQRDVSKEG